MESLVETIIYLIAILGIIFTSMSVFTMFTDRNIITYKVFKKRKAKQKSIEVILKFNEIDDEEQKNVIDMIKNGNYNNIQEVIDVLKIEQY